MDYQAKQAASASMSKALHATHPHLTPADGTKPCCVVAAKNIRTELKAAYPGVTFSVKTRRYSGGNSIDVDWTDGPTSAQVSEIIDRYSAGDFDGMTDCYNYENRAWTDAFGDAKFVFPNRHQSPHAIAAALRTLQARYPGNFADLPEPPTVEQYFKGELHRVSIGLPYDLSALIHQEASRRTWAIARRAAQPQAEGATA